jgi:hypothetical protein
MGFLDETLINTVSVVKNKIQQFALNQKANKTIEKEEKLLEAQTDVPGKSDAPPGAAAPPKPQEPAKTALGTAVGAFVTTLWVAALLFLGLLAGRIVACDVIHRSPAIRLLYFIYGCFSFPLVLAYYAYRYFKGTFPYTGYGLLPLRVSGGETDNFFQRLISYVPDANQTAKVAAFMKAGRSLIA